MRLLDTRLVSFGPDQVPPSNGRWEDRAGRPGDDGAVTYTTVGTVSPPALLGGLVDLDVLDDQVAGVETLCVGIGLSVLEEAEQVLSGLDGPSGFGDAELLPC